MKELRGKSCHDAIWREGEIVVPVILACRSRVAGFPICLETNRVWFVGKIDIFIHFKVTALRMVIIAGIIVAVIIMIHKVAIRVLDGLAAVEYMFGILQDVHPFLGIFKALLFWGRGASEVVAATGARVRSSDWSLRMQVVNSKLLELLGLGEDAYSFFAIVFLLWGRKASEVVATTGVGIRSDNWSLRMQVVNSKLLELLGLGEDVYSFFAIVFLLWGRIASEVIATTRVGIRSDDWSLWMQVVNSKLLEMSGLGEDPDSFAFVFLLWGRGAAEIVATTCVSVGSNNWPLGMEEVNSKLLEL